VIELHPAHLVLRLKDLRDRHFVAYDALLWRVMKSRQSGFGQNVWPRGRGARQLPTAKAVVTALTLEHSRNVRLVDDSAPDRLAPSARKVEMLIFASARRSPRAPPLAFRQHAAVHPACSPSREPKWGPGPDAGNACKFGRI
jgi:hypothetical protein